MFHHVLLCSNVKRAQQRTRLFLLIVWGDAKESNSSCVEKFYSSCCTPFYMYRKKKLVICDLSFCSTWQNNPQPGPGPGTKQLMTFWDMRRLHACINQEGSRVKSLKILKGIRNTTGVNEWTPPQWQCVSHFLHICNHRVAQAKTQSVKPPRPSRMWSLWGDLQTWNRQNQSKTSRNVG